MKLASKNVGLLDAIIQLQLAFIIGVVCLAWFHWLYNSKPSLHEIENAVKKAATVEQVEALANQVRTLEQQITERTKDFESWNKTKTQIMDRINENKTDH